MLSLLLLLHRDLSDGMDDTDPSSRHDISGIDSNVVGKNTTLFFVLVLNVVNTFVEEYIVVLR